MTAVAIYLIVSAMLYLVGDLAAVANRQPFGLTIVLLAAAMTIIAWPIFWGYTILILVREAKK